MCARDMLAAANRVQALVRDKGGLAIFILHSMAAQTAQSERVAPTSEQALLPGSASYELHPALTRTAQDVTLVEYQSRPLHPTAGTHLRTLVKIIFTFGCS